MFMRSNQLNNENKYGVLNSMLYKETDRIEAIEYYENDLKEEKLMRNYLLLLVRNNLEVELDIFNQTEDNDIAKATEKLHITITYLNTYSNELVTTRYLKVKNERLRISDFKVEAFIQNIKIIKKITSILTENLKKKIMNISYFY